MLDVSSVPVESSRLIKNACIEKWTKIYVKWKLVAGSRTDATIENRNIFGTGNILRFIFFSLSPFCRFLWRVIYKLKAWARQKERKVSEKGNWQS